MLIALELLSIKSRAISIGMTERAVQLLLPAMQKHVTVLAAEDALHNQFTFTFLCLQCCCSSCQEVKC